jgi:hypothetical protein
VVFLFGKSRGAKLEKNHGVEMKAPPKTDFRGAEESRREKNEAPTHIILPFCPFKV